MDGVLTLAAVELGVGAIWEGRGWRRVLIFFHSSGRGHSEQQGSHDVRERDRFGVRLVWFLCGGAEAVAIMTHC